MQFDFYFSVEENGYAAWYLACSIEEKKLTLLLHFLFFIIIIIFLMFLSCFVRFLRCDFGWCSDPGKCICHCKHSTRLLILLVMEECHMPVKCSSSSSCNLIGSF